MQFLERTLYSQLKKHLSQPEISLILGPRQAGKTTLMLKLAEELTRKNQATAFFNLDVLEDKQFFQTQHTLLDRVKQIAGNQKTVVFIDEIHRLEDAGLFLKGLYDLQSPHKFVVSGSGSLELKANVIEPMTGRKKIFSCLPLSFTEFAANRLVADFEKVSAILKTNPHEERRLVNEYLTYGGYPRVVLSPTHQEKVETLTEIYQSYLERDIELLLKVEKTAAFQNLVKLLANQVGGLVNRAQLSSALGVTQRTVTKYISLLEKTFVVALVPPFYKSARRELTRSPKVYFLDLGLLHLAQGRLPLAPTAVEGGLFENACFLRLKELDLLEPPHFWRTKTGAEVDFIISSPRTGEAIPIEVKISQKKAETVGKGLISFMKKYHPWQTFIYTQEQSEEIEKFGHRIIYLPFSQLPKV